ncbi:hypothetical protein DAEQUDRAFT_659127 [Daedalea quercina L-15889]|uniref:C2H2-type domain-containing protein n=1 Tax=Daedalea quercina L-15889 TaxID=1314783 RepID=A0A165UGW8_9APHY|nr:hypothetical protein DAEQUDRAFT_659127 [Daedalea quercina L-15889]
MSDTFAQFYAPTAPLQYTPNAKGQQEDAAAYGVDEVDYSKQNFDFFHFGTGATGIVAPHPDQFESELDSSLAAFDAELNLLPVETTGDIFSFLRSDTPTCGPPSSFTVSSESVSGYDSNYTDSLSAYSFNAHSPTPNYAPSNYSYTQELDMDFKRMALPGSAAPAPAAAQDDRKYASVSPSGSIRSSPKSVPTIARYSPQNFSPRGSFSDYEPAQPQHSRMVSSAASDYYPQAQVSKTFNYGGASQQTVSPSNVSAAVPSVPSLPMLSSSMSRKLDEMPNDSKKKYQCPSCPRAFARAYNLKTHIQTHDPNRAKPYVCHHKSCGRSFSRKHDLTRHLVSIHRSDAMPASSSIGVGKGPRGWCDNCGKGWVGKDKGCDCDEK